jgi:hypothetical protein
MDNAFEDFKKNIEDIRIHGHHHPCGIFHLSLGQKMRKE